MPILAETSRKRILNSSLSNETIDVGKGRSASEQIGLILDNPPLLVPDDLGGGTRLTQRWKHGAVHDRLASMPDHVIMTYYGDTGDHEIAMSAGAGDRQNITSRTRPGTITIISTSLKQPRNPDFIALVRTLDIACRSLLINNANV